MAESMREALEQAGVTPDAVAGGGGQSGRSLSIGGREVNVGEAERWASTIGGGALAVYGLTRGSLGGIVMALVGGALIYRGATGHCDLYAATGINTAGGSSAGTGSNNPIVSVPAGRGLKVEQSVTINKSPAELYSFWRNFENLPRFMNHLESVTTSGGGNRSHWVAKAPAGTSVEWDAEIYNEKPNELIAWRSLEGSQVDNAGSVHFEPAQDGQGTTVRVSLKYDPPGGALGAAVARLFGENPEQQIADDLQRFKQLMETGQGSTIGGDLSSGRGASA